MRALAILSALAMVASLFLPWTSSGSGMFGIAVTPWDLLKHLEFNSDSLRMLTDYAPPVIWVFVASVALAALFAVLAVVGVASRLLAVLAGGGAIGISVYGALTARDQVAALGLPIPATGDLMDMAGALSDSLGFGLSAWGGGALVLFLTGLIGFGARR